MNPVSAPALLFDGGRYQVQKELGRGGMGVVYACLDAHLSRMVAIKSLASDLGTSDAAVAIFLQEAQALAALDHPNLVRIFDARQEFSGDERIAYLIMEYVEGVSLEKMLYDPQEPLLQSLPQSMHLMVQVADALHYCHLRGIIHRDIKPANVLVQEGAVVKLVDFGLARSLDVLMQRATRVRGTPAYMAPEQIVGEALGPATDIYALGVSLYEVICKRTPFIEGELTYHQVYSTPAPPSTHVPTLPAELDELVMRCLEKDPQKRPQSAEEVAFVLRSFAAPPPPRATGMSQRVPSRPGVRVSEVLPAARAQGPLSSMRLAVSAPLSLPSAPQSGVLPAAPSEPGAVSDISVARLEGPGSRGRLWGVLAAVALLATAAVIGIGLWLRAPAKGPDLAGQKPGPSAAPVSPPAAGPQETQGAARTAQAPAAPVEEEHRKEAMKRRDRGRRPKGQLVQRGTREQGDERKEKAPAAPTLNPASAPSAPRTEAKAPATPAPVAPPAAKTPPAAPAAKAPPQQQPKPATPRQPEAPLTF